jgi:hypothetical protein
MKKIPDDKKIQNDEQMYQTLDAMRLLYRGLASLRADILPVNPRNYAVFAEGPVDTIRELQAQIDEYFRVDLVDAAEEPGRPGEDSMGTSKAGRCPAKRQPVRSGRD